MTEAKWHEQAFTVDPEAEIRRIEEFIRGEAKALGRSGAVLGLSGGIDSAVVAALAARALGAGNVLALLMPERDSRPESAQDAKALAAKLGIEWRVQKITPILKRIGIYGLYPRIGAIVPRSLSEKFARNRQREILEKTGEPAFLAGLTGGASPELATGNAYYRSKHRVRMILIYFYAERMNRLALGCSNLTEHLTGYFVRYGDDTGDISPIEHLYKVQVRRLAEHLGVTRAIIDKAPSPDLVPGVTDEIALGLPYEKLDVVLAGLRAGRDESEIVEVAEVGAVDVERVRLMCERSERKRHGPVNLIGETL